MTQLLILLDTILKRDRHKYKEWGWKKNDKNLDIRPGSEYHSGVMNEINFLVFQKKLH